MYEIIDNQLMIKSCSIGDLTLRQTSEFLAQWEDDSSISKLTLFYDNEGYIVINREGDRYELIKKLAVSYMGKNQIMRESIRKKYAQFQEEIIVMDTALKMRYINQTINMVNNNNVFKYGSNSIEAIDEIAKKYGNGFITMLKIFTLGTIEGKRAERARRKRLSV